MDFSELDNIEFEIVDDSKIEWLLSLLRTSSIDNEYKYELECELETFSITPERYEQISSAILYSQIDIINAGFNYTQTDINRKLKKEI